MDVKVDVARCGDEERDHGVDELQKNEDEFRFYAVRRVMFIWAEETDSAELFQCPRIFSILRVH